MQHNKRITAIAVSLAVGIVLMGIKFLAFFLTGSAAILSDALESIINVVAASFALVSVYVASRPPDKNHPYGHGKMELFSAGFEGSLIILAALAILYEGVGKIVSPEPISRLGTGLILLGAAGAVNLVMGAALIKIGKKTGSKALNADGKHLLTDVYTSAGVLIGLIIVKVTGLLWLDGLTACAVALNILWMGVGVLREASAGLMDKSDPELLDKISHILARYRRPNWIDIHRLRAIHSGDLLHIDFHLLLPRDLSFQEAHEEIEFARNVLVDNLEGYTDVNVHGDPCDPDDCPACDREPCDDRSAAARFRYLWNGENTSKWAEAHTSETNS